MSNIKDTKFNKNLQKHEKIIEAQHRGTNTGQSEVTKWAKGSGRPIAETKTMEAAFKAATEVTSKFGTSESSSNPGDTLQITDKMVLDKINTELDILSDAEKVEKLKELLKKDELESYAKWKDGKEDELFDIYAPGDMAIGMQEMWHVNRDLQKAEIIMLLKIKNIKEMEGKLDNMQHRSYEKWIQEKQSIEGNFSHPNEYANFIEQQLQKLKALEKQTN